MADPSLDAMNSLTPEKWMKPEEVMRLHRLRMKKKALQARMNKSETCTQSSALLNTSVDSSLPKRKNPFSKLGESTAHDNAKRFKSAEETTSDTTLFKLLNLPGGEKDNPLNFTNILSRISVPSAPKLQVTLQEGTKEPPVDWTLRTKLRFIAKKPFPWNTTLRTCEEASGITGFVRCIDMSSDSSLDTSPNAQFHQACLLWQHPSLPWLELYPRQMQRGRNPPPPIHPTIRDSLHRHWADSFRSLYQLLRARQCPYFYFVTNTFTCLFRAAGISGYPHTHVLITPTTRGFRKTLRDQDIEFRMPLRPKEADNEDTGYVSLDASRSPDTNTVGAEELDVEDEDGEEAEQWLKSMGVEAAEIKRISSNQADAEIGKEKRVDRRPESLLLIEDTEAHVLFNMLLNCKSIVATTGPLAGVPPTLLAPVAFHGATLRSLQVRESKIQMGGDSFYSMEMRGPVLPTTVQHLCNLLQTNMEEFSIALASHESTKAFTLSGLYNKSGAKPTTEDKENTDKDCTKSSNAAFCQEGLSDCGQSASILRRFCSSDSKSLQQFDNIKFSNEIYSWSL